jgi:hypothetical protein
MVRRTSSRFHRTERRRRTRSVFEIERIVFSCLPLKLLLLLDSNWDLLCREKFSKANVIELEKDRICGIPIRISCLSSPWISDIAAMSNERGRDDCLLSSLFFPCTREKTIVFAAFELQFIGWRTEAAAAHTHGHSCITCPHSDCVLLYFAFFPQLHSCPQIYSKGASHEIKLHVSTSNFGSQSIITLFSVTWAKKEVRHEAKNTFHENSITPGRF